MKLRIAGTIGAVLLSVVALTGAATPPTATLNYHGVFTSGSTSGPCSTGPAVYDGVWNVQIKSGDVATVGITMLKDGKIHAVWRIDTTLTSTPTPASFSSSAQGVFMTDDTLSFNLHDGVFTYTLSAPSYPGLGCTGMSGVFVGELTN